MLSLPTLETIQARAAQAYAQTGLPGPQLEQWHYTPLQRFWQPTVRRASRPGLAKRFSSLSPVVIAHTPQGFHIPKPLADGIVAQPLAEAVAQNGALARRLARQARQDIGSDMAGANLAQLHDGLYMRVHKENKHPVLLHWRAGRGRKPAQPHHTRLMLDIEPGARCTFIELGEQTILHNLMCDLQLGARARVTHIRLLQNTATTLTQQRWRLGGQAQLAQTVLLLGHQPEARLLTRHMTELELARGAHANLRALTYGTAQAQTEIHFRSRHASPASRCSMRSHHILWGEAVSVFQGCIEIARHATKVEAEQNCMALLCSPRAQMNAQPALRIFADDVACAHGVSIGELDAQALLYLRTRGLPLLAARSLLLEARMGESLSLLDAPLAPLVGAIARQRLLELDTQQYGAQGA